MHALVALAYAFPVCRPLVLVHFFRVAFLCVRPLGLRVVVIMICRAYSHINNLQMHDKFGNWESIEGDTSQPSALK